MESKRSSRRPWAGIAAVAAIGLAVAWTVAERRSGGSEFALLPLDAEFPAGGECSLEPTSGGMERTYEVDRPDHRLRVALVENGAGVRVGVRANRQLPDGAWRTAFLDQRTGKILLMEKPAVGDFTRTELERTDEEAEPIRQWLRLMADGTERACARVAPTNGTAGPT